MEVDDSGWKDHSLRTNESLSQPSKTSVGCYGLLFWPGTRVSGTFRKSKQELVSHLQNLKTWCPRKARGFLFVYFGFVFVFFLSSFLLQQTRFGILISYSTGSDHWFYLHTLEVSGNDGWAQL